MLRYIKQFFGKLEQQEKFNAQLGAKMLIEKNTISSWSIHSRLWISITVQYEPVYVDDTPVLLKLVEVKSIYRPL